jgi:hypothetical protein
MKIENALEIQLNFEFIVKEEKKDHLRKSPASKIEASIQISKNRRNLTFNIFKNQESHSDSSFKTDFNILDQFFSIPSTLF